MTDKPAHRVYRGIAENHDGTDARILVMAGGAGPTERERATVLYELTPDEPYWWGYGGGSPSRTATASGLVLAVRNGRPPGALPRRPVLGVRWRVR